MSIEMPAALVSEADAAVEIHSAAGIGWIETAVAVLFATAAVLGVSFIAVMTGLV